MHGWHSSTDHATGKCSRIFPRVATKPAGFAPFLRARKNLHIARALHVHKLSILAIQPHGASVCLTWKHMGDAAVRGRALRNDSTSERGQDYCLVRLDRVVLFQSYLHNENPQWLIVIYCYSLLFAPSLSHLHFSCSYILGATRTNERFLHRALFFVLFHFMFRRHPSGLVIFRCWELCRTTLTAPPNAWLNNVICNDAR